MKRIILSVAVIALTFAACKKDTTTTPAPTTTSTSSTTTKTAPVVTTTAITAITATSAVSGVTVTSDGGDAVTLKGIVWSTATAPTTALATKTTDGTGNITGLTANTKYYVRAYATNSVGTSYGAEVTFTATAGTATNTFIAAGTGDILITEFQTENTATEFVEIYNASGKSLQLINYSISEFSYDSVTTNVSLSTKYWLETDNPNGTSRHSDSTNTAGRVMAAGEYLIIVAANKNMSDFVAKYPGFDSTKVVRVKSLTLSNASTGDEIAIVYQSAKGASYVYEDAMDWNLQSNNLLSAFGGSIPKSSDDTTHQRTDLTGSADVTTKWKVATATPGKPNN